MAQKNVAVIFAGGIGRRMENQQIPKQFMELWGKPVLAYTLDCFQNHAEIDGIVLVVLNDWLDYSAKMAETWKLSKIAAIVPGGATSQESIHRGLEAAGRLYETDDIMLIHDGVRPLIDERTITSCIQSVRAYGSAITVSPQMETVMMEDEHSGQFHILDRSRCFAARAPQCFYLGNILNAHRRAVEEGKTDFVDCANMMEYYGHELHSVQGPMDNIKITTALDFHVLRAILETRELVL